MRFVRDRRGQSVVVGTVILFGFLILALASYQAFAVPAQNNQVEFDHSQDLQSDMEDLRASLLDVRDARQNPYQRPVRVSLGTRYESRLFAVNPPPPDGALTTQNRGPIDIQGARVDPDVSASYQNTEPLFDETHDTRLLTYRPNYNEYRNPPRTTLEHSLLYNRFDGANQTITGQRTIDGDDQQITLTAYSGDLNKQGLSTTIDPETLDGPTPTVPIESETGGEFTVTLPTHSPNVWTELIGTTPSNGEPNAAVVDSSADSVTVELTGEWDLQMARVGYDGGSVADTPFSNVTRVDDERTDRNISRIYDVSWNDLGQLSDRSEPVKINGTVESGGEPIDNATVDFATANPEVAAFVRGNSTTQTVNGEFETNLSIRNSGEATLYAASGDDVDRIKIETEVFEDEIPMFEGLEAEVTDSRGGGTEANEVTFTYADIDPEANGATFSVTRDSGSGPTTSESRSGDGTGSPVLVSVGPGGGGPPTNNFDLQLRAELSDGQCLEAVLTDSDDTASQAAGDWSTCS